MIFLQCMSVNNVSTIERFNLSYTSTLLNMFHIFTGKFIHNSSFTKCLDIWMLLPIPISGQDVYVREAFQLFKRKSEQITFVCNTVLLLYGTKMIFHCWVCILVDRYMMF